MNRWLCSVSLCVKVSAIVVSVTVTKDADTANSSTVKLVQLHETVDKLTTRHCIISQVPLIPGLYFSYITYIVRVCTHTRTAIP